MGRRMGLDMLGGFATGREGTRGDACSVFKQKFRWLLTISGISGTKQEGVDVLPPLKASRPSIVFKEMEVRHLTETIYYPTRPEWKPINLTLYDLKRNVNPVFEWLREFYDPQNGEITPAAENFGSANYPKKPAVIEMYDGCGEVLERWELDNAWPQSMEFGDLDMASSEFVVVDITLRYDRANIVRGSGGAGGGVPSSGIPGAF